MLDLNYKLACIKKLKAGYKVLVMGNHDAGRSNYERVIKQDIHMMTCPNCKKEFNANDFEKVEFYEEGHISKSFQRSCPHCAYHTYNPSEKSYSEKDFKLRVISGDNHLFDEVKEGTFQIGPKIMLSHEPLEHSDFWLNIHGHNHTNVQDSDTSHFNAIAECLRYLPISLNEIIEVKKLKDINDIHRKTIDRAIERKHKKGAKHGK